MANGRRIRPPVFINKKAEYTTSDNIVGVFVIVIIIAIIVVYNFLN